MINNKEKIKRLKERLYKVFLDTPHNEISGEDITIFNLLSMEEK